MKTSLESVVERVPARLLRSLTSSCSFLFQTAEGSALPCMHRHHHAH